MERRRAYGEKHWIQKVDYATDDNPFAGRVISLTAEGLTAERFGIQRMKGFEGLFGDVIQSMG